jgi:hypothetical protein
MKDCEKTRVSANEHRQIVHFKKVMFLAGVKKLFVLQEKRVVFLLLLTPGFSPV